MWVVLPFDEVLPVERAWVAGFAVADDALYVPVVFFLSGLGCRGFAGEDSRALFRGAWGGWNGFAG